MEASIRFGIKWPLLFLYILAVLFPYFCDARKSFLLSKDVSYPKNPNIKHLKILEVAKNLNMLIDVSMKDSSNPQPYVSSPFTLPPYDSLAPIPLPDNINPPFCVYPPPLPQIQSPSTTMPSPIGPYSPTPSSSSPTLPLLSPPPGPPVIIIPGPPESFPSPSNFPPYNEPGPPAGSFPGPPEYVPSPVGFAPSPPVFQPPVVYPPPTALPSPPTGVGGRGSSVWCVAKPTVPEPIIQEAMNYACGSGTDCSPIQPNGLCFQPNSILAHASYAFNSYWQRTRVAGGTCSFGGTAMLVTVDPSSNGCRYING